MDAKIILEALKEGGAIVLAGLILAYAWNKDRMNFKITSNHLTHETASRDKLTEALTKLSEKIDSCPFKKR